MAENEKLEVNGSSILAEESWREEIIKLKERYGWFEKMNHGNWDTWCYVQWKSLLLKDYEELYDKALERIEELKQENRKLKDASKAVNWLDDAEGSPLTKKDFHELKLMNAFLAMKIDDLLKDSEEKGKKIKALQEENEKLTREVNRLKEETKFKSYTSGMMRMID
jgi:cell division protein FtsB